MEARRTCHEGCAICLRISFRRSQGSLSYYCANKTVEVKSAPRHGLGHGLLEGVAAGAHPCLLLLLLLIALELVFEESVAVLIVSRCCRRLLDLQPALLLQLFGLLQALIGQVLGLLLGDFVLTMMGKIAGAEVVLLVPIKVSFFVKSRGYENLIYLCPRSSLFLLPTTNHQDPLRIRDH